MKNSIQIILLSFLSLFLMHSLSAQQTSSLYGESSGSPFLLPETSDSKTIAPLRLKHISIVHKQYIEQIEITWKTATASRTQSTGKNKGGIRTEILFKEGEYIRAISGSTDRSISSLAFHTNKRRIIGYHGDHRGENFHINAPAGKQIIGFKGKSGDLINQIGAVFSDINTPQELEAPKPAAWKVNQWSYLVSKVNKLNLDVQGGSKASNTKIWMYTPNSTLAQQWMFIPAGNGYYYIKSRISGLFLNVKDNSTKSGALIWQRPKSYSSAQMWKPINAGGDYFYLQSKSSGLYLDVRGGGMNPGTEVWQHPLNRTDAQKWSMK